MSQALEGKRVLLVDDDNDILISMQAAFEPTGAIVETAHDGNRAVELAEKNQPDLVVLDMMLQSYRTPGGYFLTFHSDQLTLNFTPLEVHDEPSP